MAKSAGNCGARCLSQDAAEPGAGRRRSLDGEQQRIGVDTPCRDGDDTEHRLCRNDGRHQFVVALQMSRNRVATGEDGMHAHNTATALVNGVAFRKTQSHATSAGMARSFRNNAVPTRGPGERR